MVSGRWRRGRVIAGIFILGLLGGCSESSPTGPLIDKVVGTWVGSFTSVLEAGEESGPQALKIVVRTEGEGRLTAFNFFNLDNVIGAESLYFDVTVSPDGSLEGEGSWFASVFVPVSAGYRDSGTVTGFLDTSSLTGSGTSLVGRSPDFISIEWEVRKDTGR